MHSLVDHQFVQVEQQREAQRIGMWIFLASEILLFGGLFTSYAAYRILNPEAFAEASKHLYQWIGITNTGILLLSSLTMALAVHAAKASLRKLTAALLISTAVLGSAFLVFKGFEYYLDFTEKIVPGANFDASKFAHPNGASLFFILYFIMTAIHATHLLIAISIVTVASTLALMGRVRFGPTTRIEPLGLYWHFVDVIWVFLLPLLYFIR